jgi:hypothetical protein
VATLPAAPARLLRRPVAVFAVALVAAIAATASQIGISARAEITSQINAHWRGAYDLLVRPEGARLDLEQTGGLVEPNFVGLSRAGGITTSGLEAIRAVPGVALAAPISWVGLLTTPTTAPSIEISRVPSRPTLYRAALVISTSDGLTDRLVLSDAVTILIGPPDQPGDPPIVISSAGNVVLGQLSDGRWTAEINAGHSVPQIQSPIIAVDPVAERELLGAAGSFLDPLVQLEDRDPLMVGTTDPRIVLDGYQQGTQIAAMQQEGGRALTRPVLPVLVSSQTYAPVRVSVTVNQIGQPLAVVPDRSGGDLAALQEAQREAGSDLTLVGSNAMDWADSMRALRLNGIGVPWPGTDLVGTSVPAFLSGTEYRALLASRPVYQPWPGTPVRPQAPAFRIEPQGPVPPGGPMATDWTTPGADTSEAQVGQEQAYRSLREVPIPVAAGFGSPSAVDAPYVFAPVGEYDLNALELPHDPLDYVPFGAYDPPDATLIGDGSNANRTPLSPTLNPAGLLAVPPMAIADIRAAELLRGNAPIDAVRVRVSEITDYGPDALARVAKVAGGIAALGFDVDVVAASSPQVVAIYVPEYDLQATPATDLGWVEQHWTTLGAAPRVERGLTETNLALLILAILGFAVVAATVELVSATARAKEAAILAALGWRRDRVIRWQSSESAVAGVAAAALAALAWAATGRHDLVGLAVAGSAGLMFLGFGLIGALLAHPRQAGEGGLIPRSAGPTVSGPRSYALRSVLARPGRSIAIAVGVALSAGVIAPAVAVLSEVGSRVGPTTLASALSERLEPYQLGLIGLVATSALGCAALVFRVDARSRRREFTILIATGWSSATRGSALRWMRILLGVPAALLAALVAAALAGPIGAGSAQPQVLAGLGGLLGFVATVIAGRIGQLGNEA